MKVSPYLLCFSFERYSEPNSEGGVCDLLAYSPKYSLRSTWATIASPRFSIFERDRSCDDLNSLNLEQEQPRGRILTGKHPIVNIMAQVPEVYEDEEFFTPNARPTFSGFTGRDSLILPLHFLQMLFPLPISTEYSFSKNRSI